MGQRKKTNGPIPPEPTDGLGQERTSRAASQGHNSLQPPDNGGNLHADEHTALLYRWLRVGEETFSQLVVRLTARQREVLHTFLSEPNDARVARLLNMSLPTVRTHLRAIERSLQVGGRTHLAIRCLAALAREALAPPPPQ